MATPTKKPAVKKAATPVKKAAAKAPEPKPKFEQPKGKPLWDFPEMLFLADPEQEEANEGMLPGQALRVSNQATIVGRYAANVLTSVANVHVDGITNEQGGKLAPNNIHFPVLDLCVPAVLVPSSTPGHSHLIIFQTSSWTDVQAIEDRLASIGAVSYDTYVTNKDRGYAAIRTADTFKYPNEQYTPEALLKEVAALRLENFNLKRDLGALKGTMNAGTATTAVPHAFEDDNEETPAQETGGGF